MANQKVNSLEIDSLLGRYRILKKLGAGGMGEVFLAEDAELERRAALKILPAEVATDAERIRRFMQEAKAASALNHPNILTIYEIGAENGRRFIASEYITGETLRRKIETQKLTLGESVEIAVQIAAALDAAHSLGIVHRDIKPENVMIRPDGLVKILDFGIAKLTEKSAASVDAEAATIQAGTSPGMIIGTATYMSPEQARGKKVDFRSDIFSFGILLYEMLTGRPPFTGENAIDTIGSILHREFTPVRQFLPEIPSEIERILNKMLKKDADERYQTTRDLLIDLKEFRQESEFQKRLGISSSSGAFSAPAAKSDFQTEAETQILKGVETVENASPENETAQTASNAKDIARLVKDYKFVALAALGILVIGLASISYFTFFRPQPINSIAVLPFVSAGDSVNNNDGEYLSDGLSEKLIDNLSQIGQLKVIARSSSFKYRGENIDIQEAASKLRVDAILTGRVTRRGDNLQISVELVNGADSVRIWGDTYNRRIPICKGCRKKLRGLFRKNCS
jgi:eukaryotic-like serine/threonine-protein kinase